MCIDMYRLIHHQSGFRVWGLEFRVQRTLNTTP